MSGFLARHKSREVFFRDDTHPSVNVWATELHFGFYRLIPAKESTDESEYEGPEYVGARQLMIQDDLLPVFPGDRTSRVVKATIGFRFVGDLHDRYWTCHVLSHLPGNNGREGRWLLDETSFNLKKSQREDKNSYQHSQRKILEARLFDIAAAKMVQDTKSILAKISRILDERVGFLIIWTQLSLTIRID